MHLHIWTYMQRTIINENRSLEFDREKRQVYGRVWMGRKGRGKLFDYIISKK